MNSLTTYLAESLAVEVSDDAEETLRRLGTELAVTGIVLHGSSESIAAIPDGMRSVPTIHIDGETDLTGTGDRFGAGLAHGLAREWEWDSALRLGNLCSSYHVEQGETGSRETLSSYADSA